MAISYGIGATPGGMIGAELSSLVTASQGWISACSTGSNYLLQSAVFLSLNHYSNSNLYRDPETGRIRKLKIAQDFGELAVKAFIPDVVIYGGRSALVYWFQQKGMEPVVASLVTDIMIAPVYAVLVAFTSKQMDASAEKLGLSRVLRNGKGHNVGSAAEVQVSPAQTTPPAQPLENIVARTEGKGNGTPTPQ